MGSAAQGKEGGWARLVKQQKPLWTREQENKQAQMYCSNNSFDALNTTMNTQHYLCACSTPFHRLETHQVICSHSHFSQN